MNEKIMAALGELAEQVSAKLKVANIELAVFNDGSVVPADKYDNLKAEHKGLQEKYQSDISEVNNNLEKAMADTADYEGLKGTLESLKSENSKIAEDYQNQILNIKMDSKIERALLDANIDKDYIPLVKSQLNKDSLKFDGDNLNGLTDFVESAKTQFPKVFGEMKKMGVDVQNGSINIKTKKQQLIEQYEKASAKEKLLLLPKLNEIKQE